MIQKLIDNYKQPTPVKWRKIGDSILFGSTSLSALMMGAPISDHAQTWIVWILNLTGVIGKIITNFFKDENTSNDTDNTN